MFQSTPPAWGATRRSQTAADATSCFNPRPPRGGRHSPLCGRRRLRDVSIHAPRVGGDAVISTMARDTAGFNPRPPRGGRPRARSRSVTSTMFQSTPPAWGATASAQTCAHSAAVSIHAPAWGATSCSVSPDAARRSVSIHAPAWGATLRPCDAARRVGDRVSIHAPRVGGDSAHRRRSAIDAPVSIHAPRVGGDAAHDGLQTRIGEFQSTPPAWGATLSHGSVGHRSEFQSTPPAWGATARPRRATLRACLTFQSTPPAWGATPTAGLQCRHAQYGFNPRPPRGGRPNAGDRAAAAAAVSIHAPRVGGDGTCRKQLHALQIACHKCDPDSIRWHINHAFKRTQEYLLAIKALS